jgi:hypothetical protein
MLQWLNHRSVLDGAAGRAARLTAGMLCGLFLVASGWWLARNRHGRWLILVAAGSASWTASGLGVGAVHRRALPLPRNQRPLPWVVIDRTLSEVPLFTGAFADDKDGNGYGMLEQWIPRVGNITAQRRGAEALAGDGLVLICPTRSAGAAFRDQLVQYVQAGGKLLVFDSWEQPRSTANSVLWPFGLTSDRGAAQQTGQTLRVDGVGEVALESSCAIRGGQPLAWWNDMPVAAQVNFGRGSVTAVGFGSLFDDASMGFHWLPEPEPDVRARYEVLYALLRRALPSQPLPRRHGSFP